MNNHHDSYEKVSPPASRRSLSRREWVQRMLAGAGMATPALAGANSMHARLATALAPVATQAEVAAGEWKPAFFDDHQNRTLVAVAERIVPGSTGAQVNRFLDTALGVETQESQQRFVASLNALEGESLRRFTQPFQELSANQQDEILTAASTAQPSQANSLKDPARESETETPPPVPNLRDYFDHLKGWISLAYYSSETGMKELGWTGDNFFESFPGCEHAGGHS